MTKDLVKLMAEEEGSKAKTRPYNRKLPLQKLQHGAPNMAYTDLWHKQVSSRQSVSTGPNLSLINIDSPFQPVVTQVSVGVYEVSGFCERRVLSSCCKICLFGSWVK